MLPWRLFRWCFCCGTDRKINNPNASGSMLLPMATSDAEGQSRAIAYIQLGYAVVQERAQKTHLAVIDAGREVVSHPKQSWCVPPHLTELFMHIWE